jgi:quinol monooxygenase YgiN
MEKSNTVLAVISHEVNDYDLWRKFFDTTAEFRKSHGVVQSDVFRCPTNPNKVFVTQAFASVENAKAFLQLPGLKENMQKAGVVGKPDVVLGVAA